MTCICGLNDQNASQQKNRNVRKSNMSLPPLSALRAFEAAARLKSLSEAGRELNVTHAAIAQQIRKLEDWMGRPLMRRVGRGVEPTDDGKMLADGLNTGFGQIIQAVEQFNQRQNSRPLIISVTPNFASHWLIPRLGAFREAHPDIELTIDATPKSVDLSAGDADIAIRFGKGKLVLAAAATLVEGREISSPKDLRAFPLIQELGSAELHTWLRAHGLDNIEDFKISQMAGHLMLDMIRNGHGIGISTSSWVNEDLKSGRIVSLFEARGNDDLAYYVVTKSGVLPPAVKAFCKWCLAQE